MVRPSTRFGSLSDGAGPGIDAPVDLQVCADGWSDLSAGPFIPVY